MIDKHHTTSTWFSVLYSSLILAIGMGLGRFIFTPLLPGMLDSGWLDLNQGSWMAAANYLGYLLGCLFAASYTSQDQHQALRLLRQSALVTSLLLLAMAGIDNVFIACGVRFLAGIASAGTMIFGSVYILSLGADHKIISAFYAGVGTGILFGNEWLVFAKTLQINVSQQWLSVGVLASLLTLLLYCSSLHGATEKQTAASAKKGIANPGILYFSWQKLLLIYGLAGYGYIINATYLPMITRALFDNVFLSQHLWSFAGLAVIPSCFIWRILSTRLGYSQALSLNLLVQGIGISMILLTSSPGAILMSALILGGTFMGTVIIALPFARQLQTPANINIIALMTLTYGLGQISGPVITAMISTYSGAFDLAVISASGALFVAAVLSCTGQERKQLSITN